ncbi:type II and III secretion system protein family protein, partial [bacterium]|nr:type II and III secretion system protein family protein [bacterium]
DGETLVLGGLSRKNISSSVNKFPFLGDIPILGKLFTRVTKNSTDQEVIFLITVRLINTQR